ncbi:hypothetical protein PoB_000515600 [Plakobranchus ocellatus]|uniref:Uncharacterized protein n=1 Tax=Plakobranchus ocellatus TaxID=259542 RepID=A0AAV3XUA4_9GAST|nr:hypothetical protein PoB_000515600 [Plakobranchus ocellatus]
MSVDDSTIVLDDNNSDEYNVKCRNNDSTVGKLDGEETSAQRQQMSMTLSKYLGMSHMPKEQRHNDIDSEVITNIQATSECNLWLDLAEDSISSITPTLYMGR